MGITCSKRSKDYNVEEVQGVVAGDDGVLRRTSSSRPSEAASLSPGSSEGEAHGLKLHVLESHHAEATYEMDEDLWSQLGDDLIKGVLLRLPYACQCRFRAVSKIWLEILSSTRFMAESQALRSAFHENTPPVCVYEFPSQSRVERSRHPSMGDTSDTSERPHEAPDGIEEIARRLGDKFSKFNSRKMHHMDLSFTPWWTAADKVCASRDGLLVYVPMVQNTRLAARRGGLCVVNPFTRTWRALPPVQSRLRLRDAQAWPVLHEVMVDSASPSHFVVYVVMFTMLDEEWFICRFCSSQFDDWSIIPGDPDVRIEHRTLCLAGRYLYSWHDAELWIYSLENGKLLTVVSPGGLVLPPGVGLPRNERMKLVEHEGTIYGVMSLRSRLGKVIGISRLCTDMCWEDVIMSDWGRNNSADMSWEEAVLMPEWAVTNSRRLKHIKRKRVRGENDERWRFQDYTVIVLGDYICFKLIFRDIYKRRIVSQSVIGFHILSRTWKSFDLHVPHVKGGTLLELFVPKCFQVYL